MRRRSGPVLHMGLDLAEYHVLRGWRRIMLTVRRCPPPAALSFRRWSRDDVWIPYGDHIRGEVGDDLLLADALRALLPPYRGPSLRLWRGEIASNRRSRRYGLAWSRHSAIADGFARGIMRTCEGGSVVLETNAPIGAIICSMPS